MNEVNPTNTDSATLDNIESKAKALIADREKKEKEEQANPKKRIYNTINDDNKIHFDIPDDSPYNLRYNIARFINEQQKSYKDLYLFCMSKRKNNQKEALVMMHNMISSIKSFRNFRADTIELICEFLQCDLQFVKSDGGDSSGKK